MSYLRHRAAELIGLNDIFKGKKRKDIKVEETKLSKVLMYLSAVSGVSISDVKAGDFSCQKENTCPLWFTVDLPFDDWTGLHAVTAIENIKTLGSVTPFYSTCTGTGSIVYTSSIFSSSSLLEMETSQMFEPECNPKYVSG